MLFLTSRTFNYNESSPRSLSRDFECEIDIVLNLKFILAYKGKIGKIPFFYLKRSGVNHNFYFELL